MRFGKRANTASKGSAAKVAADASTGNDVEGATLANLRRAEEHFREQQQRAMEEFLLEQRGAIEALASALKTSRPPEPGEESGKHALKARDTPQPAEESDDQALKASNTPEPAQEDHHQERAGGVESLEETNLLAAGGDDQEFGLGRSISQAKDLGLSMGRDLHEGLKAMQAPMLHRRSLQEVCRNKTQIEARNSVQEFLLPVTDSYTWKLLSALLVLSMSCELGLTVHCKLRAKFDDHAAIAGLTDAWVTANTILFMAEFVTNALAEQKNFFCGKHKKWNLFDSVLLAINLGFIFDLLAEEDFGVLRVLRLLRMLRLLEIFPELRTMIYSICACAQSVVWSACLLFCYIWMVAIYLMEACLGFFRDREWHNGISDLDDTMIQTLEGDWSSMNKALLSLIKAVTGGADWGDLAAPFFHMRPWGNLHCAVFLSFIMSTTFVLFNIVVGLIVTKSEEVGSWDRDTALLNAQIQTRNEMEDLAALFDEFDTTGNGSVTVDEIANGLETPRIKAFFRHLHIDIVRPDLMLKLFDENGTGDVDKDEFVAGCLRLQGAAKPAEIAELLTLAHSINNKLND